jgi:hypothetical protein
MANMKIEEIEGIGPVLGEKFTGAGVKDTDGLLEKGCSAAGRKALAEATGLSASRSRESGGQARRGERREGTDAAGSE